MRALLLALACCLSLAAPSFAAAQLPSQDQFYIEPANISSYKPGDVIRSREIPGSLSGFLVGNTVLSIKTAYQYFYRTTNLTNQAVGAVTTLLVPNNADPGKLLVYQTAYDSTDNNCVPSYSLQAGGNSTASADIFFIAASLNRGWYVVTSDYEGLNTQFLVGQQAAYGVLDSVRAAFHQANTSGLHSNATYALFGYSGGSLASEWAAEFAPTYAPELNFTGLAMGGLATNVSHIIQTINGTVNAQLAFSGITGLARGSPAYTNYINQHLIPSKRARFQQLGIDCMSKGTDAGKYEDIFSYFDTGIGVLADPVPYAYLNNSGVMGLHGKPRMPVFMYKAIGDEIAPINDTDALYNRYCANNNGSVTVHYQKDLIGGHDTEAITGSATAFSWIADRLDGKPVDNPGQCYTTYVALTAANLQSIVALGEVTYAIVESLVGGKLGPAVASSSSS